MLEDYFENRFEKEIKPIIELIFPKNYTTEPVYYTLESGRNRFRSVLPLIIAELTGFDKEKAKIIGAVAEITWTSMIIHDDIIDKDIQRRGKISAYIHYDLCNSLCSGVLSYLYGSMGLMNNNVMEEVVNYNQSILDAYTGEMLHQSIERTSTIEDLLKIYNLKTSLGVWGLTASALGNENKRKIKKFGTKLGEAGQIKNDLNDLFVDTNHGVDMRDLRGGILNLPLIIYFQCANKNDLAFINQFFGKKKITIPSDEIRSKLYKLGIIDKCFSYSREKIESAESLLADFPKCFEKDILVEWARSHSIKKYLI